MNPKHTIVATLATRNEGQATMATSCPSCGQRSLPEYSSGARHMAAYWTAASLVA
jgi:hypothetical protein